MKPEKGEGVLCGHVEFHESLDRSPSVGVAGRNILRAKETSLLAGIEMEFDRGGGLEVGVDQDTEDLDGIDGTGAILERALDINDHSKMRSRNDARRQHLGHVRAREIPS